jgi:hypothetical protein
MLHHMSRIVGFQILKRQDMITEPNTVRYFIRQSRARRIRIWGNSAWSSVWWNGSVHNPVVWISVYMFRHHHHRVSEFQLLHGNVYYFLWLFNKNCLNWACSYRSFPLSKWLWIVPIMKRRMENFFLRLYKIPHTDISAFAVLLLLKASCNGQNDMKTNSTI